MTIVCFFVTILMSTATFGATLDFKLQVIKILHTFKIMLNFTAYFYFFIFCNYASYNYASYNHASYNHASYFFFPHTLLCLLDTHNKIEQLQN